MAEEQSLLVRHQADTDVRMSHQRLQEARNALEKAENRLVDLRSDGPIAWAYRRSYDYRKQVLALAEKFYNQAVQDADARWIEAHKEA